MYLGKREIFDIEKYEEHRKKSIEYKPDATFTAFSELEDIINKTDTTQIISTDTLYLEKTYTDTVPKYINQVIFKTDTVYRQKGDSIEAEPMIITLKKKIIPTQL